MGSVVTVDTSLGTFIVKIRSFNETRRLFSGSTPPFSSLDVVANVTQRPSSDLPSPSLLITFSNSVLRMSVRIGLATRLPSLSLARILTGVSVTVFPPNASAWFKRGSRV